MKGTLFSADFVKDSNNDLRLLELNTDTGFYDSVLSHFDFTGLHDIISSSNITNFHVISKRFQDKFVTELSQSLASQGVITSFNETIEEDYTIYPTVVEDAADKFILRLAYDESTVFDSTYCKDNSSVFTLFHDNADTASVAEIYLTSSAGVYNSIRKETNPDNIPDLVVKSTESTGNKVHFVKLGGTGSAVEKFDDFRDKLVDGNYILNYYNDATETYHSSFRSYNIVYGNTLDIVNLANVKIDAILDKPTSLSRAEVDLTSSHYAINDKHFYEFSTNYPFFQPVDGYGGIFEEQSITSASGDSVPVVSASVGGQYQSYFISGSPDTDQVSVFGEWTSPGQTVPSGSYVTSSVLINSVKSTLNKNLINNLTISGGASVRLTGNQHLLVYNSTEDVLTYKEAYKIDEDVDSFLKLDGTLADITSNTIEILDDTHSAYLLDLEEVDTYIVDGAGLNIKVVAHNACFPAGTEITLADGDVKNIEDIQPGEEVISFDTAKKEFVTGRVSIVQKSIQEGLVTLTTETGEEVTSTLGHKMWTADGWRDAKDIKEGDYLLNSKGDKTKIVSVKTEEGENTVYHLTNVGTAHTYFANGVLVHNYSMAMYCFIANTQVRMADNTFKNIQDVRVGDKVVTLNEKTGKYEPKEVYQVLSPIHNDLVTYKLADGTVITSTYDHPFYGEDLNLVSYNPEATNTTYKLDKEVTQIYQGEKLVNFLGERVEIEHIDAKLQEQNVKTYIIRVEDNHNFFANDILVHNK